MQSKPLSYMPEEETKATVGDEDLQLTVPLAHKIDAERVKTLEALYSYYKERSEEENFSLEQQKAAVAMADMEDTYESMMAIREQLYQAYKTLVRR